MKTTVNALLGLIILMFILFAGYEENVATAFIYVLIAFLCVVLIYIINFEKSLFR